MFMSDTSSEAPCLFLSPIFLPLLWDAFISEAKKKRKVKTQ